MLRTLVLLALASVAICSAPAAAWGQATAILERMPTPPGHTSAEGNAISGDGKTIVGFSGTHTWTACRWKAGAYQDLGVLPGFAMRSEAYGVSGDGSVVVGVTEDTHYDRAFRWTAAGMAELATFPSTWPPTSAAYAISDDGEIVVGSATTSASNFDLACYWDANGIHSLGSVAGPNSGVSAAQGVNPDGSVIVGYSSTPAVFGRRPFRWDSEHGMEDLGSFAGPTGVGEAKAVSADGSVVVGYAQGAQYIYPFRWTRANGMVKLPSPADGSGEAFDLSDDGRVIVGYAPNVTSTGGSACVWLDGAPARPLWDILKNDYGIDPAAQGWEYFTQVESCSADGRVLTGVGGYWPGAPYQNPVQGAPFRVTLPRLNVAPTLTSAVAQGAALTAAADSTFLATFRGQDADQDEELTLEVTGLPNDAVMTPIAGTKGPGTAAAPFLATFEWTPTAADVGSSFPMTVSFRDSFGVPVSRNFTISVRSNVAPSVTALTPQTIECIDGDHSVDLSTTVSDTDADTLTVTWKVGGVVKKTQTNVPSDATVTFSANYAHGAHTVAVEASDGFAKGTAGTTITVQDTGDPTIVVAGDAELTTDPGKAYASKARLPLPTGQDGSGHPVTLTSDAPAQFPLGESTVVWTATDGAGHQATATQRVIVVDEEKPGIVPSSPVVLFCDPGKTFATRKLTPPKVRDNVPGVTVATSAGTRFGIGVHRVLWTATDAFGNASQWVQTVTTVNRKPKANAGKDLTVTTASPRGVRLALNGSASSDPDKHKLKYAWNATKGVRLAPLNAAKPAGTFPVGTTSVTLTVTDAAGARHADIVKVTVKLKSRRPRGSDADRSFAAASQQASQAVTAKGSNGAAPGSNSASLAGLAYARAATSYGHAAGALMNSEASEPQADVLLVYSELRALQRTYGQAAAQALLSAYAESGDEGLLAAYGYAAYGTAYAAADLNER